MTYLQLSGCRGNSFYPPYFSSLTETYRTVNFTLCRLFFGNFEAELVNLAFIIKRHSQSNKLFFFLQGHNSRFLFQKLIDRISIFLGGESATFLVLNRKVDVFECICGLLNAH